MHRDPEGCFHFAVLRMILSVGLVSVTGTRPDDKNYSPGTKDETIVIEKCFKFKLKLNIRRQCSTFSKYEALT